MRGVGQARGHGIADEVAGQIPRLDDVLGVVHIVGVGPAAALDVNFAMRVGRVVTPGEQPKDHARVDVVDGRIQLEPVAAVAKGPPGDQPPRTATGWSGW